MLPLQDKVVMVTGASDGIGKVTARALAEMGAHVVMVCRPSAKAEAARQEIAEATSPGAVELLTADLSSQAEIRAVAAEFRERHERLHVLCNNAGLYVPERRLTADGLELTFALDHLGYFLLTHELREVLAASAPARIVNVSSEAHRGARIDFDDLQGERKFSAFRAYGQAKLGNVLFTYELARRLEGTGVTVNCLHPGVVRTGFGRDSHGAMKVALKLISPFMASPDKGAETSIYLASSPEVQGATGQYFAKCKPKKSSPLSYDRAVAQRLWEVSEKLTGVG